MTPPVLELDGIDAAYGPFRALFGVSLVVPDGGSVALLGPNGSGKTTVARVASGLVAPTRGTLAVDGQDLTGQPAWAVARAGVLHAPEGRSVFGTLTVARIKEEGTALLIIEQHVHHALEIADEAVILHQGRVAFTGPAEGLASRADLLSGGLDG